MTSMWCWTWTKRRGQWLAEHGYDKQMGARPMARLIQEKLKKPLAEKILFGELADHGGHVHVGVENGKLPCTWMRRETEPA
jgi:ATP-dependent Clp protease ATP-binding subunit ClpA